MLDQAGSAWFIKYNKEILMKRIILLTTAIFKKAGLIAAFVAMNAVMANLASAGSIPVANHSFEDQVLPPGGLTTTVNDIGFPQEPIPGWTFGTTIVAPSFTDAGVSFGSSTL